MTQNLIQYMRGYQQRKSEIDLKARKFLGNILKELE